MRNMYVLLLSLAFAAAPAFAHCDGLDGPVVSDARKAIAAGDARLVLHWVPRRDEAAVRQAFDRTLAVRKLSAEAAELADTWFFETLVRIHRAGEGAPFDGLKPAGRDPGPAITAAERAIRSGSDEALSAALADAAREGLHHRFHRVLETRGFKPGDTAAGREYVAAYVDFLHHAERLHQAATFAGEAHAEHKH